MLSVALDWDDEQIRMVAGESDGGSTRLRHAAIVPVGDDGLVAAMQSLISQYSLQKCPCLVAVGRDQAELRQMDFPPVPVEELPDMVRFQAIRQFASAGDSATVDFITTQVDDQGVKAIVSATGPNHIKPIRKTIESTGWTLQRIALRPIASAALYRIFVLENSGKGVTNSGPVTSLGDGPATLALIDLVSDEAEIVLMRRNQIVFVRSVRLPSEMPARTNALAGEIRRSMMACGAAGTNCNVIMWGVADRHAIEIERLGQRLSEQQEAACLTELIDPLELVGADDSARQSVGETVGRLAPLVGLLAADKGHAANLIDFENPRQTIEVTTDRRKVAAMVGIPAAVVAAIVWMLWGNLARLDRQIERQMAANAELRTKSEDAEAMIDQTARVDQFLNGDVNWLEELQRLATTMPASDQLILREVNAASDARDGGGRLVVSGRVTSPKVIDEFEATLRDESHQVIGDKVTQLATEDAYRWQMTQTILVSPDAVRSQRYDRIQQQDETDEPPPEETPRDEKAADEEAIDREEILDGTAHSDMRPTNEVPA